MHAALLVFLLTAVVVRLYVGAKFSKYFDTLTEAQKAQLAKRAWY